jgi:isocitrate dehydrogenase
MNIVIFRENTEDVYAGIEWPKGSQETKKLIPYLKKEYGVSIREDSGIGIKPISETATKRLVRKAIQYAFDHDSKSVTLVHKGNIMKYTEGAFRDWGYEIAKDEFAHHVITESEAEGAIRRVARTKGSTEENNNKLIIKDRIADSMFQQVLTRTEEYDVIALPNLNGDYLSDACAAQVGGLGMAPGANIGDFIALFEATHGTAPKYAGLNKINPSSLILSGVMMLEYINWKEAADRIIRAVEKTIREGGVTQDLARMMDPPEAGLGTSEYAAKIIQNL